VTQDGPDALEVAARLGEDGRDAVVHEADLVSDALHALQVPLSFPTCCCEIR
jgi:hypothetical protein